MTLISVRRALRAVLVCAVVSAASPAIAGASTWTVDDDKAQCPNAAFTSIQAAVNQAAPHDTIVVCAGTYVESSTPTNNASSPVAAGSTNGLTIAKSLTIKGAGANLVTITVAGPTLGGTTNYLRDGGGNVVTISRQSLGSTDADENRVDISGVTITAPSTYVDAGVAFFNTSGSITNSVIGPFLVPTDSAGVTAHPYEYGVIETDSLQGGGLGTVRREVTVANSRITGYGAGGILFDDAFGNDAATTLNTRSGIIQYGYVTGTRVEGNPASLFAQTGVRYRAGQRGSVTGSEIVNNSTGLLLNDAELGPDPNNTAVRAFSALGNNFSGNSSYALFSSDITNTSVRLGSPVHATDGVAADENWFGCTAGPIVGATSDSGTGCQGVSGLDAGAPPAPSVELGTPAAAAPAALTVPGATLDLPPTASFVDPLDNTTISVGQTITPTILAGDDFGVTSVTVTLNGLPFATIGHTPYETSWTPTNADIGSSNTFVATITDSAGQTTTATLHVNVAVPPGYHALTVSPTAFAAGTVLVGLSATQAITVTNTGLNPVTLTGLGITGAGFSIDPSSTCTSTTVLAIGGTCIVTVKFAPTTEGAVTGSLTLPYTAPAAVSPATVALSGNGHILSTSQTGTVSGDVASTLALLVDNNSPSLGHFVPGVSADYSTSLTVAVTSSALNSVLTAVDPSATAPGHLLNGAFALASPLQVDAVNMANPTATFGALSGTPLTLLTYPGIVANDPAMVSFKQSISAVEPLRAGLYSKTIVFTLSSTTP